MQVLFDIAEMQAKGTPSVELKKIFKNRYKAEYYKAPERAGSSYMLSPILRTYENAEKSDKISTVNIPHIMYYAPNVTNEDIGGTFSMVYPSVLGAGKHAYIIQPLGMIERAVINKEYEDMISRLCKIKEVWCLPKDHGVTE